TGLAGHSVAWSHRAIGLDRPVATLLSKMRKDAPRPDVPTGFSVGCFLLRAQLDLALMKTIAIFGCGAAGKRAWTQLRHAYKVVSFLDNDADKQRSRVAGIPVADPAKYNYALVDHVFIASIY